MNRRMNGFTLIELVIVIIVLGILSATAIPKFINLKNDANHAVFNGQFAAFKSAVNLYHSGWSVKGHNTAIKDLEGFGNNDVDSSERGYPFAVKNSTTDTFYACEELWTGITNTSLTIDYVEDEDLATADVDIAYTYRAGSCLYRALPFIQAGEETVVMDYNFITGKIDIKPAFYNVNGSLVP